MASQHHPPVVSRRHPAGDGNPVEVSGVAAVLHGAGSKSPAALQADADGYRRRLAALAALAFAGPLSKLILAFRDLPTAQVGDALRRLAASPPQARRGSRH